MGVLGVGLGKVQEALPFFKTALASNPSIVQYWLSYIDALLKLDRINDAKVVFDQANSHGIKGGEFDKLHKRLKEGNIIENYMPQVEDLPNERLQALLSLYRQGKMHQVFNEAQKLTKQYPKSLAVWNLLGTSAAQSGQADSALFAFQEAISINPHNPEPHYNLGIILQDQNKPDEAIGAYSKALSIKPDYAEAHNNMGVALKDQGMLDNAIEAYSTALSIKPDYAEAYNNIGFVLQDQGKLNEALEAYYKALSIKPDYAEAQNNIGVCLKDLGKLDEAIEAYRKAISIKPDSAQAYNNIGISFQDQGKLNEALEAYSKALSLKPDYAEAQNNMGVCLKDLGKLDEAIEAYSRALSIKPDYAEAYNNTTELLKIYSSHSKRSHTLFAIDNKIKDLNKKLLNAKSKKAIISGIKIGLNYVSEDSYKYKSPYSQIYCRNNIDLNCKRHFKIFDKKKIIPEFCFGCFKVQVDVDKFVDLIKLTTLFYNFDFDENLTKKTIIELRPKIPGFYKGFIYCRGLGQAKVVHNLLTSKLEDLFDEPITSKIKRGCSEYVLDFPEYGKLREPPKDMMSFPKEWKVFENQIDENELTLPEKIKIPSLPGYCLSDFYIIQKWIDYAKGIGDDSVKVFNNKPIIFRDVYKLAKTRLKTLETK